MFMPPVCVCVCPPGGERWSWLDLTHIRPPCLSNVIFLSTKQPCGGLSASGRWGSLCGQLYCSKFDETTLSVCFLRQSRRRKRDWGSEMWMRVRATPAAAACIIYIICIITHLHTWNSQMPTQESCKYLAFCVLSPNAVFVRRFSAGFIPNPQLLKCVNTMCVNVFPP